MSIQPPTTAPKPIRSPSYPAMALRDAIEQIAKIERVYRLTPVDRTDAVKLMGYAGLSGPAAKALADLASYGLLERAGKGHARVTERARDIIHAESPEQRRTRLLEAALEPDLFRELRERFEGIPIPPEDGVVTYLNRQGFNPNAVRPAAKSFLETMSYLQELGVSESHRAPPPTDQNQNATQKRGGASVGDLVQWEADGVLKLEAPTRVRALQTHDGEEWVFVDGSETGIPMSEVIVVEKKGDGSSNERKPPTLSLDEGAENKAPPLSGTRKEVIAFPEGDVIFTYPDRLSPESYEELEAYMTLFLRKAKRLAELLRQPTGQAKRPPDVYEPGETVPTSGMYTMIHPSDHKEDHSVSLKEGDKFPPCQECGEAYYKRGRKWI